jgi:hypothetical protein
MSMLPERVNVKERVPWKGVADVGVFLDVLVHSVHHPNERTLLPLVHPEKD